MYVYICFDINVNFNKYSLKEVLYKRKLVIYCLQRPPCQSAVNIVTVSL